MDEEPCQPGEISGQFKLADLSHGGGPANGRQAPLIVIPKRAPRLVFKGPRNRIGDPVPLLDCYLSDARQQLALLISDCGQIADYEYFRMSRNAEVGLDKHAAGAIDGHA